MSADRQSKEAVGYSEAATDGSGVPVGEYCGRCANYRPAPWFTSGACVKVEGPIGGRYWCRLFEARAK